jgi:hypothetical protein
MAGMPDPPFPSTPALSLPSPTWGQPAEPKIATANKEMSSLGLLSLSAGTHFFQLWFKLRNTNVFLVSTCCQHFCSACSGATGRAHKLSGEDFEKQFDIFFFFCLESGKFLSFHFPEAARPRGQGQSSIVAVHLPGMPLYPHPCSHHPAFLASLAQKGPLLDFLIFLPYKRLA